MSGARRSARAASELASLAVSASVLPNRRPRRAGPVKQEKAEDVIVKEEPNNEIDTNGVFSNGDTTDAVTKAKRASQRLAATKPIVEENKPNHGDTNNDENVVDNDKGVGNKNGIDAVQYAPIKIRIPRPNRRINIRIKKDKIEMEPVKVRISKRLLKEAATAKDAISAAAGETPTRTKSALRGRNQKKMTVPQQALASVFVKCTAPSCGKWRLLSSVNVDPQVWTCSMNTDHQYASCEAPLQEFNGLVPPKDITAIAAIEVAQPSSAPLTLKDTSEWTEEETEALVQFVAHHGLNAWTRLNQDPILCQNHTNPEFAEERFNMLFGLASGNIKPEPTFNVLRSSGVQHMNNPYVREFLSRYYPHHMSQLRQQYQQYAYHLAQQMVRNPVRAQYVARQTQDGYGGRGGVHYNEDGESYVSSESEEEESEESSSGESEELPMDLESDSDDEFGRKKSAKKKKERSKKEQEPKFVEYKRPEGARSSGRLSGTVRKSYAYDEFACVEEDDTEESGDEEPAERIDKIFAARDHLETCAVHKHKSGQAKKVTCECETQYFLKPEGVSYIHCEWLTMTQVEDRFSRPGVEKVKRYLKKKDEIDEENLKMWGGEPFNPDFAEVEKIIASQMVQAATGRGKTVEMFLVKWKELSYGECTWETRDDINNESKIEAFIANNTIPDEETERAKAVTPTPSLIAEWYKESPVFKNGNSLRDYQLQGLNWLVKNHHIGRNTMLADEMGLGKTIQSVALLYHLSHSLRIHGPFMVIVPLSTIGHWYNEIQTWTEMNVVMYHDTVKGKVNRAVIREHEFFYQGTNKVKFHVLLTTYETLLADINDLSSIHWQQLIIDEGHRLKNRNARLLTALMQLQGPPKLGPDGKIQRVPPRRVLLTGTPIQNSTEELWTLLNYIAPFEFYSLEQFMQKFGNLKDSAQVEELQNAIRPYVLRRMKENVEKSIPPKEETIIDIELTTLQKQYYRAIYEKNRTFLSRGLEKSNIPRLINIEMELRKCCNHPWLIKGVEDKEVDPHAPNDVYCSKTIEASGKMVLLDKLLPKLYSEGHRVLVFSQMRQVLDILEFYVEYRGYPYERLDGHTHGNDRQRAIDNFSREGSNRFIFLLSTRAGGVGLNLTAADTVIIFDSDWNPQQDVQAQARVHRIGQQRNVSVYRLITRNTYEAEMFERASKKLGLDQAVLTTMMTDEGGMGEADKQDLERLLRRGAYGVLNDDDTAAKEFCDANIDEILARQSRVVVHKAGSDQNGGTSLGALQYQKMTFASEGADLDIDINDPHFWEKVLAKEARNGEGTAQDLAKMFHMGLECAEGKPHPIELERQAAEAAVVASAEASVEKEAPSAKAEVEGAALQPESAPMEVDSTATAEAKPETKPEEPTEENPPAAEAPVPAETPSAPEAPPKKKRGRQSAAAKAAAAKAAAAAAAVAPKKPEKFVDDRLNFKTVKGRQTFMDALRVKVQRTLSAREAGEHIPDLFELIELLHTVAASELYFSKKQKDQTMQWAKELESRGRRRTSRGGFQIDEAYEDAYMSVNEDDPDEIFDGNEMEEGDLPRSGGRPRGRGGVSIRVRAKSAPKKVATPAKSKSTPKSSTKSSRKRSRAKFNEEEDDEGDVERPRRSARPGRYKVKFVMGSDDEVIHSREVDVDDDETPNRTDATMADGTASAAESTDSDETNERSGRSNR